LKIWSFNITIFFIENILKVLQIYFKVVFLKPWGFGICKLFFNWILQILKLHGFKKTTLSEHAQWHLDRALGLIIQWLNLVGFQKKASMELVNDPWTWGSHRDVALGRDCLILFQATQQAPWSSRFPAMATVTIKSLSKRAKSSKNIKDPGFYHWEALACNFPAPTLHAEPRTGHTRPRARSSGPIGHALNVVQMWNQCLLVLYFVSYELEFLTWKHV
jgi:hypothetical protein